MCVMYTQHNWEWNKRICIFQSWWLFLLYWSQYYSGGKKEKDKKEFIFIIVFLLASLLSGTVTFLPQMLTSRQTRNICYWYHFENSETQRTAGLCIYYGHKWNLQSQWDLSSQMTQLKEIHDLRPFAPAWTIGESGMTFAFWLLTLAGHSKCTCGNQSSHLNNTFLFILIILLFYASERIVLKLYLVLWKMLSKYNLRIDHSSLTNKDHGVYSSNLQNTKLREDVGPNAPV